MAGYLYELREDVRLSWDELLRRNEQWHATHDRWGVPYPAIPDAQIAADPCWYCHDNHHQRCTGRAGYHKMICPCSRAGHGGR